MEYKIVSKHEPEELMHIVKGYIMEGWKPLGGVSVTVDRSVNYKYHQAMTKEKSTAD